MFKHWHKGILAGILVLAGLGSVQASQVEPDQTFGSDGNVITSIGATDWLHDLTMDQNGKLVAAGATRAIDDPAAPFDFALARYNADGSLDTNFGSGGIVVTDADAQHYNVFNAIAVDESNRIVAGGFVGVAGVDSDPAIVRYNPDGSLDKTFGVNGMVITIRNPGLRDELQDILVTPTGKILSVSFSIDSILLMQHTPDGQADASFGKGGVVTLKHGVSTFARSLTLDSEGKILVVGSAWLEGDANSVFVLARFNPDGSVDSTFGNNGIVIIDASSGADWGYTVNVDANGKIIVGGITKSDQGIALFRYNPDGRPDPSFASNNGSQGMAEMWFEERLITLSEMLILPDGKILLVGGRSNITLNIPSTDLIMARYTQDGNVDTTFGEQGFYITDVSGMGTTELPSSALIDSSGQLVVAGTIGGLEDSNFFLARYQLHGSDQIELGEGGFDAMDNWKLEQPGKSGQYCKDYEDKKFVAYSGICSFRFVGETGKTTRLIQQINTTELISAGSALQLSAWVSGKGSAEVSANIRYADGSKESYKLSITSDGRTFHFESKEPLIIEQLIDKIKLTLTHTSDKGKLYIDDISLTTTLSNAPIPASGNSEELLPLPN
jgi:uncharacterized delta-60 repeat protein